MEALLLTSLEVLQYLRQMVWYHMPCTKTEFMTNFILSLYAVVYVMYNRCWCISLRKADSTRMRWSLKQFPFAYSMYLKYLYEYLPGISFQFCENPLTIEHLKFNTRCALGSLYAHVWIRFTLIQLIFRRYRERSSFPSAAVWRSERCEISSISGSGQKPFFASTVVNTLWAVPLDFLRLLASENSVASMPFFDRTCNFFLYRLAKMAFYAWLYAIVA